MSFRFFCTENGRSKAEVSRTTQLAVSPRGSGFESCCFPNVFSSQRKRWSMRTKMSVLYWDSNSTVKGKKAMFEFGCMLENICFCLLDHETQEISRTADLPSLAVAQRQRARKGLIKLWLRILLGAGHFRLLSSFNPLNSFFFNIGMRPFSGVKFPKSPIM